VARKAGVTNILNTSDVTNLIYSKDIRVLSDALGQYEGVRLTVEG